MFLFLKEAFKNMEQTGSVMESSPYLAGKMIKFINFSKPVQLLELGAGTGCITRYILSRMINPQSRLTAFEINPTLFAGLKKETDDRFFPIQDNVRNVTSYLKPGSIDYIISGLPLANMSLEAKNKLLTDCYHMLKPGGYFIQFQYSCSDIALIRKKFGNVSCTFTLLNLPPAFVYYAKA